MEPSATSITGFSPLVRLESSLSTSLMRRALAMLMATMTNTMATIIRLIRMFMQ